MQVSIEEKWNGLTLSHKDQFQVDLKPKCKGTLKRILWTKIEYLHKLRGSFLFLFYLFVYFWLRRVFIAERGLSLVVPSGVFSSSHCMGFSLWWGFSSCGAQGGLSSCGTDFLPQGIWNLPRPGSTPVSHALAGRFLSIRRDHSTFKNHLSFLGTKELHFMFRVEAWHPRT